MKICKICGRDSRNNRVGFHKKSGLILCEKHKGQYDRNNRFLSQTRYEPNIINIRENIAYICLNDFHGNIIAKALIDVEDIEKVLGFKWFMRMDNRVVANIVSDKEQEETHLRLHNVIMSPTNGFMVDHIEGNPLDNQKSMLRIVTEKQNSKNNKVQSNNSSGVTGVVLSNSGTWTPQIKHNRKMIRLGNEKSFDKAVIKRLKKRSRNF